VLQSASAALEAELRASSIDLRDLEITTDRHAAAETDPDQGHEPRGHQPDDDDAPEDEAAEASPSEDASDTPPPL
jgi:hypothetical protein